MNKNRKWYSLFLVILILIGTVITPVQTVLATTDLDAVTEEVQTKDIEAPVENNIEEANQVVEEEATVTSTEETQPTEIPEETSSSEKIDVTITSEEKIVESSISEVEENSTSTTEEKVRVKRAAKREAIDIKKIFESGEKFLSDVSIEVFEGDKLIEDLNQPISSKAEVQLRYKYEIPKRLLDEKLLKAGDYYEVALPKGIFAPTQSKKLSMTTPTGEQIHIATYNITGDKIQLVFTDAVETLYNIHGTFEYGRTFENTLVAGENEIIVPLEDEDKTISVALLPGGGNSIKKSVSPHDDNKTISWSVSVNENLSKLENAEIVDYLPKELILNKGDITIFEQKVDLDGKPISTSETALRSEIDYTITQKKDNSVNIKFLGEYANSNKSFKLSYQTVVKSSEIPEKGGTMTFTNKAELISKGEKKGESTASTSFTYGELLAKASKGKIGNQGQIYGWNIKYNYGNKELPKGNFIIDTLESGNLKYTDKKVSVKNQLGEEVNHKIEYQGNQMKIIFPDGLSEAVDIYYETEVSIPHSDGGQTNVVDDSVANTILKNTVKVDDNYKKEATFSIQTVDGIKNGRVDYLNKKIHWDLEFNKHNYPLTNLMIKDNMSEGLKFDRKSLKIYEKENYEKKALELGEDYKFVESGTSATSFEIEFVGKHAQTTKTYIVVYETEFSDYQTNFNNKAILTWTDDKGRSYSKELKKDITVDKNYVVNATKTGSYNAKTKQITWQTIVNYNQDKLENATISDPIIRHEQDVYSQEYVDKSARLYEVIIKRDGVVERGAEVTNVARYDEKTNTVSANLPDSPLNGEFSDQPGKAYMLVFETTLKDKLIASGAYKNEAVFVNDNKNPVDVTSSVTVDFSDSQAIKTGEQNKYDVDYVDWTVKINPAQSTIENLKVIDKPSANQILKEDSIVVYQTSSYTDEKGKSQIKKESTALKKGKDYLVDVETNNETGEQKLTIEFPGKTETAYWLEYRTLINSSKRKDKVTNTFSVEGHNKITIKDNVEGSAEIHNQTGTATGTAAAVRILKVDKVNREPLEGVEFELWSAGGRENGQLLRTATTDAKGEIRFLNLRSGYTYKLYETKSAPGFNISEELSQKGGNLRLESDRPFNEFQTKELKNDIPRINLTKKDSKTGAPLADATFVIKNAAGKFYNGINEKNKVIWVDNQKEAKKLVSDKKGSIEVVGLEAGIYSAKEIKAPVGYDKLLEEIDFEVINDLGWLHLKTPITISNKEYAKTSIKINKKWDDVKNQDDKRPTEILFALTATYTDGKVEEFKERLVLTGNKNATNWEHTFSDLRKFDDEMNEIKYTVKEIPVDGYQLTKQVKETTKGTFELTNSYIPEKTSIKVNKIWADENNQDGIRPEVIKVNLLAGLDIVDTVELKDGKWSHEFTGLAKYRAGNEIQYSVEEVSVDGYQSKVTKASDKSNEFNITNSYIPKTQSIKVNKVWNDANNQDGKRASDIKVQLYAGSQKVGQAIELNDLNKWKHTWNNLAVNDAGKEIVYTVKEMTKVPGYDESVAITGDKDKGFTITNTRTPELTKVTGKKVWVDNDDQDGIRPKSITVNLVIGDKVVKTQEVKASDNWMYTFENLPKYEAGNEIKYSVKEEPVPGYDSVLTGSKKDGFVLTNTHTLETTEIPVTKIWEDDKNQAGVRPNSVTINLYGTDKENPVATQEVIGVKTSSKWSYTFTNLPKKEAGKVVDYTIEEMPVGKGYKTLDITGDKDKGFIVTNSRELDKVTIKGTKTWKDEADQDGIRPKEITVNLLADGQKIAETKATEKTNWKYEFTNLPKFQKGFVGHEIKYSVQESPVDKYSATIDTKKAPYDITNTYTPEKTAINVVKIWKDNDNQDGIRPEFIQVNLLANGKEKATLKLNEANNWQSDFTGLDVYKAGEKIDYTLEEVITKDYTSKISKLSDNSFVITNSHDVELTNVKGTKTWKDKSNQDGIRPETITVNLLANGIIVAEKIIKGSMTDSAWSYEFKDIPKYSNGKKINYTVTEDVVEDYQTTIKGFNITNSYEPKETRLFVEKVWNDANNQDKKRPSTIDVQLYADGVKGKVYTLSNDNNWKTSFDKLAVYAKGKEINYEIKEISAAAEKVGYKAKVTYSANKENKENTDFTVINSRDIETVSISGSKTWKDANNQDGIRPTEVTVKLLADGKEIDNQKVNDDTKWTYSFTDLPKHKAGKEGQEIKYTVEESAPGYEAKITKTAAGFDVENTHEIELTEIKGNKIWNDANNQDGIRPAKVTFNLLANGEKIASTTADEKSDWIYRFTNLPVYEVGKVGEKVSYTVEEEAVKGYESTKEGNDFTNTHQPETTELSGEKIWNDADNQDGIRPETITVNLLADGQPVSVAEVTEELDWKYEFKDLPKFKAGQEIEYTVTEDVVENYTSDIKETTITNSYTPGKRDVKVQKIWDDADNQDDIRPNSIKVQLYADGEKSGEAVELTEKDSWNYTWTELPVKQAGKAVMYEVKEVKAENLKAYTTEIKEESKGNFVITNSYKPEETKVDVTKIWDDADNQDGIRPESITVNLLAEGKQAKDAEDKEIVAIISGDMKANEWSYEFKNLPKFANGKEIKYSVEEIEVAKGYEATYSEDTFTITNLHKPKEVSTITTGKKSTSNKSGGFLPKTGEAENTALVNLGITMLIVVVMSYVGLNQRRSSKKD